jgi:two-component system chemotaxis response regulator CheB
MSVTLVAVGCSWGGLAAASRLLEELPSALGVATVIIQHRGEAPSALASLLALHTRLPVVEPCDKEPVRPGHVYVAPPGYHLLVTRQCFSLDTEGPVHFARPSIDVFFESVAEAHREGAAAVVLTGANADGAAGLARVAAAGGLALVQDPTTAERRAMPDAAIAAVPGATVADIPGLARIIAAAAAPAPRRA